jgi:hypothetical protein
MARQVDVLMHYAAMQAFVEQEVAGGQILPAGEGAGRCAVLLGFGLIMDIEARLAGAASAIFLEHGLQPGEFVRLGAEMGEVAVAARLFLGDALLHAGAVVSVKGVALDEGGGDLLAGEDLLEGALYGRGARAGRAGHHDDRVLGGHLGKPLGAQQAAIAEQGSTRADG